MNVFEAVKQSVTTRQAAEHDIVGTFGLPVEEHRKESEVKQMHVMLIL